MQAMRSLRALFLFQKHVESRLWENEIGFLGLNLEESGRRTFKRKFFSLQKEQLGIIRFIPIKLTQG
jgi:hypothetical protein